jgi:hypothetical protein
MIAEWRLSVTLEQAASARKRLGQMGALIFILFFASLLDSCVARFREPLFTVHLLPGGSALVDGQVDHDVKEPSRLRIEATSESVRLRIDRFQPSFWLGGNMWVGEISAAVDAAAGAYDLRVFDRSQPAQPPVAAFRAVVYPDYAVLRESHLSLIQRIFDVHPGTVSLACIAALVFVMGLAYLLGRRVDRLLADRGQAEIFMVKATVGGVEAWFGLGRRHGVEPGMRVTISGESGQPICHAVVQHVETENSMALADGRAERLSKGAILSLPEGVTQKK